MPFVDIAALEVKEPLPGWTGRFFHSESMTFAHYDFADGAAIHEHHHPNEEVWNVLQGEVEISLNGETRVVGAGQAVVVPPNLPHAARARSAGKALVVDYPLRHSVGGINIT